MQRQKVGSSSKTEQPEQSPVALNVNVMMHFYRGELARMSNWRDRLDRTTNWAVTAAGAMISLAFSTAQAHHAIILFAIVLVSLLLWIEARRYRFFDVFRDRVRLIEKNYLATMVSQQPTAELRWTDDMAKSLKTPEFSISMRGALSKRLRRNYIWIFLILFCAWTLKLVVGLTGLVVTTTVHEFRLPSLANIVAHAAVGPLPGVVVTSAVFVFFVSLLLLLLQFRKETDYDGEVHV